MRWFAAFLLLAGSAFAASPDAVVSTDTNATLANIPTVAAKTVLRLGRTTIGDTGVPLLFAPGAAPCSLGGGDGDGGSQVKSLDGKCWLAQWPSGGIDPRQFGAANTGLAGTDDAAIAAAIAAARATGLPLICNGPYGVIGPISLRATSTQPLKIDGSCVFNGWATTAQNALIEYDSYLSISGHIDVFGRFNSNYAAGIWQHGVSGAPSQYNTMRDVNIAGFPICWRFGDRAYPAAIVSETSVLGGKTYGCPIGARVEGTNTVISVIGQQWTQELGQPNVAGQGWWSATSATSTSIGTGSKTLTVEAGLTIPAGAPVQIQGNDAGGLGAANWMHGTVTSYSGTTLIANIASTQGTGTGAGWLVHPPMAAVHAIGGAVSLTNGEVVNGSLTRSLMTEPLEATLGAGNAVYGSIKLIGVSADVGGNLAETTNPNALSTTGGYQTSLVFVGNGGFTSHNLPFVITDASYNGKIYGRGNTWVYPGARTANNVTVGGTGTTVDVEDLGWGPNFVQPFLKGVTPGSNAKHSYRQVLLAFPSDGATLTSGVVKFNAKVTADGDLAYWSGAYSGTTGVFTVPAGGLKDVFMSASVCSTGITSAQVYIRVNGAQAGTADWKPAPVQCGTATLSQKALAAGATVDAYINVVAGSGAITNYISGFYIWAANE